MMLFLKIYSTLNKKHIHTTMISLRFYLSLNHNANLKGNRFRW
jgi:hypothetical protein